jgi:hypothetical protein
MSFCGQIMPELMMWSAKTDHNAILTSMRHWVVQS